MNNQTLLIIDVETANTLQDALTYDVSMRMTDTFGNIWDERAYVIRDVFVNERDLMHTAYYAEKLPSYSDDIRAGKRRMISFLDMRSQVLKLMRNFDCHTVLAYNCSFDRAALDTTLRFLTKSKYRWFFPYHTEFYCIWNMACDTICQTSEYKTFAELNRYYSNRGRNYRATAETVYSFLTNNPGFNEEHKGMEDVRIEHEIFKECIKINPELLKPNRGCWNKVKRRALVVC